MCIMCNRVSVAVNHEGRAWAELTIVRAAEAYLDGFSKTAELFRLVEVTDHLGGDPSALVTAGLAALDAFRKAQAFYEEGESIAKRFGIDEAADRQAAEASVDAVAGVPEALNAKTAQILSNGGARAACAEMLNYTTKTTALLSAIVEAAPRNGTKQGIASFAEVMGTISEGAIFGFAVAQRYK